MLLFKSGEEIYRNTFDTRKGNLNTKLKWVTNPKQLFIKEKGDTQKFTFNEDWSKYIHLYNNKFFVAGGSKEAFYQAGQGWHPTVYSRKVFKIDVHSGEVEKLPSMTQPRQAHGMLFVNGYVYCCAGLNENEILDSCERFCLETNEWKTDVPKLENAKFSMTMHLMDKVWVYSFGGATYSGFDDKKGLEVERLNTMTIG